MMAGRMARKSTTMKKSTNSFWGQLPLGKMTATRTKNSMVKTMLKMSSAVSKVITLSGVLNSGIVPMQNTTMDTTTIVVMNTVKIFAAVPELGSNMTLYTFSWHFSVAQSACSPPPLFLLGALRLGVPGVASFNAAPSSCSWLPSSVASGSSLLPFGNSASSG